MLIGVLRHFEKRKATVKKPSLLVAEAGFEPTTALPEIWSPQPLGTASRLTLPISVKRLKKRLSIVFSALTS